MGQTTDQIQRLQQAVITIALLWHKLLSVVLCARHVRHVRHVRMTPLNNPVCTVALQFTARSKAQFKAQFAAWFVAQFDFTVVIQALPSFAPAAGGDKTILSMTRRTTRCKYKWHFTLQQATSYKARYSNIVVTQVRVNNDCRLTSRLLMENMCM